MTDPHAEHSVWLLAPPARPPGGSALGQHALGEFQIRRLVSGRGSPSQHCEPPEDAARLIVDFAVGGLLDLLAIALVDRHFHRVASQRFAHDLRWFGGGGAHAASSDALPGRRAKEGGLLQILVPQVAQQFVNLPELLLSGPGLLGEGNREEPPSAAFAHFAEDQALLHCQQCSTPILKADDILSSNYRIMTGRAYLTSAAYNISVSEDTHEAHYTTGQYTVRHVACTHCSLRLGITYVAAGDRDNNYKIGKFLVGQQLFVRPACCLLRSRRLPAEMPTRLCLRCQRTAVRGALQLVKLMTRGLDVALTRQLYELLLRQRVLAGLAEPLVMTARRRLLAAPRALVAWCLPHLRPCPSGSAAAAQLHQLVLAGVDPSEAMQRVRADLWQETLRERVAMLTCLRPLLQGEHLAAALLAAVRFVGAICLAAGTAAPAGATRPERVPLLIELLPALVAVDRGDALRGARALVLAVRKEWLLGHGPAGAANFTPLTSAEMEAVVDAISEHAAAGIGWRAAGGGSRKSSGGPRGRLRAPCSAGAVSGEDAALLSAGRMHTNFEDQMEVADEAEMDSETYSDATTCSTDEMLLQCLACGTPILKADDVLSPSFQVANGLAYLAAAAYNVQVSVEAHEAVYMSGHYTVRDVACVRCSARLGVMYVGAVDAENQYKVGKFLLGQDQLLLPPGGASLPKDKASLRGQLLDLLRCGGAVPAPPPSHHHHRQRPLFPPGAVEVAATLGLTTAQPDARDPLMPPPPRAAPDNTMQRQQFIITIKRYIRCFLPAAGYVPAARGPPRQSTP